MKDWAHDWTDEQLDELKAKLHDLYEQAAREMREKVESFLKDYDEANAVWKAELAAGKVTKAEYTAWLEYQSLRLAHLSTMADTLATEATMTDRIAIDMVNDTVPRIYAENANYAAYRIELQIGYDTGTFTIYNQDAIRYLMGIDEHEQIIHEVIPIGPPTPNLQDLRVNLDAAKDVQWNRQKFTSSIAQAILQGESIPHAADRLMAVLNMDMAMAVRAARTAITYAETMGRQGAFERAANAGIKLKKTWHAHVDGRTRLAHREADGQEVGVFEKFVVDGYEMIGPGDPSVPGYLSYNCRCNVQGNVDEDGLPPAVIHRAMKLPKGVTYDDWKRGVYRTDARGKETAASKKERGLE